MSGKVIFTLNAAIQDAVTDQIISQKAEEVVLDGTGSFSVDLIANDSDDASPNTTAYLVDEQLDDTTPRQYQIVIPKDAPAGTVDLADIAPAVTQDLSYQYALLSHGHDESVSVVYVDAQDATTLSAANAHTDASVVTDHGALTGLSDDDHTQYTKADGTRAFTGDVDLGGNKVTNAAAPVDGGDLVNKTTLDAAVAAAGGGVGIGLQKLVTRRLATDLANTDMGYSIGLTCITYSSELKMFVALGTTGVDRIFTSSDGISWDLRTAPELNSFTDVCWSPELGLFCAVSSNGAYRVMTSPNGTTWTSRNAAAPNGWQSVCWSPELGLFCAVSYDGTNRAMTSPDGITWTSRTITTTNQWIGVCWSPELSLFCAVSNTGTNRVATSPDGITWTSRYTTVTAEARGWWRVCWSPALGLFCAVATDTDNVNIMTSSDGITWTTTNKRGSTVSLYNVIWVEELNSFFACPNLATTLFFSSDGVLWESKSTLSGHNYRGIAWSPEWGKLAVVNSNSQYYSTNP